MADRLELQSKLEELLGSRNVYYQPPATLKMEYPCIRYSKSDIKSKYANDSAYQLLTRYELIVIDKKPDNPIILMCLKNFKHCSYDRHYVSDNLNHDVLTLYY